MKDVNDPLRYFLIIFGISVLVGLAWLFRVVYNDLTFGVEDCFEMTESNCTPTKFEGKNYTKCILSIKNICPQEYNVTFELVESNGNI